MITGTYRRACKRPLVLTSFKGKHYKQVLLFVEGVDDQPSTGYINREYVQREHKAQPRVGTQMTAPRCDEGRQDQCRGISFGMQ